MNRRGTLAIVAGAVLVMASLLVAALSDPVQVVSRPVSGATSPLARVPSTPSIPTAVETATTTTTPPAAESAAWYLALLVGVVLHVLLALVVLAVLFTLAVAVQAAIRRRPRMVETGDGSITVPPVPEELLRSAATRMALLESGEPRNAIVAAWLDLESAAAESGLPRHPAETSTEYTTRVIGTWPVDRERLSDLAELYREARFSLHRLGEAERHRALAALQVLHGDLDRAATAQVDGDRG